MLELKNKNYFESNTKETIALNSLDVNNCLFTSKLLATLLRSYKDKSTYHLHFSKSHRKMIRNKEGIYLIAIRILNKKEKSLVYNYIYYNDLLYLTLVVYFLVRNYFIIKDKHELGKYLVILDNKFLDYNNVNKYIDIYNKEKLRH